MRLAILVRRRFEVLVSTCFVGLAFVGVVWCLMALLKAINPVTFHFNLLMDILPWFTPVVLVLLLFGPLYWKVAGSLAGPDGGLQRLAESRYQLVVGAFFYLLAYTLAIWLGMNLLRIWDVYDFHFNPLVDWLPAIVPPWLAWAIGAPLVWKTLTALDARSVSLRWRGPDRSALAVVALVGGSLLTGGGLLLNEGVYAVSQQQPLTVAQNMIAFGVVLLAGGGIACMALLLLLWRGWRPGIELPQRSNSLDRFRAARGRLLAHGFVLTSLAFGFAALLMAAFQAMDPVDFHFYLALDMWSFGVPLFLAWGLVVTASQAVPAWLARRDPAHNSEGAGTALGPTGPASDDRGWGYSEGELTRSGSHA
ncbi:MAG TPA: hypothetical protein VNH38_00410 [Candidatus Dormibacteraeota bacterium]|nr:hypothetical protein [Candidatus Dormibacteraeota bacterium]